MRLFKDKKIQAAIIIAFLIAACLSTYYFHTVLGTGTLFTHFFYIPIIMAAFWWKRKGFFVALFLGALLIFSHNLLRSYVVTYNDYLRALMFLVISMVTIYFSEIISKMTEELSISEERFRDIYEKAPNAFFSLSTDSGTIIRCNTAALDLLGYEKDSVLGILQGDENAVDYSGRQVTAYPSPQLLKLADFEGIHPEDADKFKQFFQRIISGETANLSMDFRFYPKGTQEKGLGPKWVYCQASRIKYQKGEAILVSMMDMTVAKEMERLLNIQDKMTSLGHVAAGIAHEIRNPLSGINIYLSSLEKMIEGLEDGNRVKTIKQIVEQLQSASYRIESVIERVMDFSTPGEPRLVMADINEPVEDAISLSVVTLRKSGIKIEKDLEANLPLCPMDPQMIEQVILNLLTNSAEAMKDMDEDKQIKVISSVTDNHILVRVLDSGPGVPPELRKKIFDPFFTNKASSTGIGLSLSHRIITDHGGILDVGNSELGGAEFSIEIPIKREEV